MSSFRVDTSQLDNLVTKFKNPLVKEQLKELPKNKGILALVAQAIADNFAKEGPGWTPLSPTTIRRTVAKKLGTGASKRDKPRMILQRTGMLKKSVTTPGAMHNVMRTDQTALIWGTDLVYAGIHNYGYPSRNIPKREFLVIRDEWEKQLNNFAMQKTIQILNTYFGGPS